MKRKANDFSEGARQRLRPELLGSAVFRLNEYTGFFDHSLRRCGDYPYLDYLTVAYEFSDDVWAGVTATEEEYMQYGVAHFRPFKFGDLERIEYYMRMMIVGSNKYGRFVLLDGIHPQGTPIWHPEDPMHLTNV
mmetsp:Transcript_26786/g.57559  ORF Transcript_26786/g.57559 Transcript_26786/m.57559 type:complete len:134 (+) Transcript_26786:575-976(+)